MGIEIFHNNKLIFRDQGKWLHPLFKAGDYLAETAGRLENEYPIAELFLKDTVIGRAAALLIVNLGIKKCHGDLMSRKALPIFKKFGVTCSWDRMIDAIECKTEDIFSENDSPAKAEVLLRARAENSVKQKEE